MRATKVFDEELLVAARAGDHAALLALLAVVQPDIKRYARKNCSHSEDADDAAQVTMLHVYDRVWSLKVLSAFNGWLYTIVKRECFRLYRTALRWVDIDSVLNERRLVKLPQEDLRFEISKCIESLPENYREVVLLRDFEEMTIDEISTALSTTRETVKARLHRARKLMREYLLK